MNIIRSATGILLLFSTLVMYAQTRSIGIGGGASLYTGDLDPVPMTNIIQNTGFTFQIFVKQQLKDRLALRLNFSVMDISASDELSEDSRVRVNRNLSFQNKIVELSVLAEYSVVKWRGLELYAAAGPSVFRHNPKAINIVDNQLVELQSLGTEGQGFTDAHTASPYKLLQLGIPMGGGIRQAITKHLSIQIESLGRVTFTDYLDDVSSRNYVPIERLSQLNGILATQLADPWIGRDSQKPSENPDTTNIVRGNPDINDYFLSGTISVIYKIPVHYKSQIKCPVF